MNYFILSNKKRQHVFIVIGKTGCGKSSVCNTLTRTKKFKTSDSPVSQTSAAQVEKSLNVFGFNITVVDTPGFLDTSVSSEESKEKSLHDMIDAISRCPQDGKIAILLVLKYGDRFTEENKLSFDIAKYIFGDTFLEEHCIIIFTCGDLFDKKYKSTNSFNDWCQSQSGYLQDLLQACSQRSVLFSNDEESKNINKEQISRLIQLTDKLDASYTIATFQAAKKKHKRLLLEAKKKALLVDFHAKLKDIQLELNTFLNAEMTEVLNSSLKSKVDEILLQIDKEDEGVYYDNGEVSLLESSRTQANQLQIQIRMQQILKIKDNLKIQIDNFKNNVHFCNAKDEVEKLGLANYDHMKKFAKYGLVIKLYEIKIVPNINEIFTLTSEDYPYFEEISQFLKECEGIVRKKIEELNLQAEIKRIEREIKKISSKLNSIPASETSTKGVEEVKKLIDKLKKSIKNPALLKYFMKDIKLLEDSANEVEQRCKQQHQNEYINTAIELATVGVFGATTALTEKVILKIGLPMVSLLGGKLLKKVFHTNKTTEDVSTEDN